MLTRPGRSCRRQHGVPHQRVTRRLLSPGQGLLDDVAEHNLQEQRRREEDQQRAADREDQLGGVAATACEGSLQDEEGVVVRPVTLGGAAAIHLSAIQPWSRARSIRVGSPIFLMAVS